ncbi:uncharacterized protein C2845_PM15G08020 [Panicum miliaceum]|uniref:Uncharacterized protein n=1 Tax=Panicum miliaceum TaxID=4540 RepID=A0A3L6Q941_PANMI|nr:uncharacterized protein C2845_PM15G08020 [Panicum miliaceum]
MHILVSAGGSGVAIPFLGRWCLVAAGAGTRHSRHHGQLARQTVILKIKAAEMETAHKDGLIYRSHKVEVYGPDMDEWDPWNPPYPLYSPTPSDLDLKSHAQLIDEMVKQNALRCAKVVLDGKAPELLGYRANPNCMNRYGYFPLHQAAEMFSVDMVKLLFSYGASANLRTAGAGVIEDLLPLHVAVENTCMHKYLEENAFPNQEDLEGSQANLNYICKLIHILCLPEMKIFLDTTRLLAENTANLADELWNYIKDGKLVQTAVLLLAAQEQIRGGPACKKKGNSKPDAFSIKSSCKKNGNGRPDGFSIIINRILTHTISLVVQIGQNRKKNKELEIQKRLTSAALLLVRAVLKAGKVLDTYIQSHPEMLHNMKVSHNEVHERVSSILKDNGFCPGEIIDVGKLYYFYSPLICFNDLNFAYNWLVHFFILLVLEAAPITMYCPKRSHLTTMGTCLQSKQVVNIQ